MKKEKDSGGQQRSQHCRRCLQMAWIMPHSPAGCLYPEGSGGQSKPVKDSLKTPKKWNKPWLAEGQEKEQKERVQQRQSAGEFTPLAGQGKAFGEAHQDGTRLEQCFSRPEGWPLKVSAGSKEGWGNSRVSRRSVSQVFIHSPKGLSQFQEGKSKWQRMC